MAKAGKILIIVSNADQFEKVGFRTGLWLSELTHFWDVAEEAGYQMDIASPSGGKVPIDPVSLIITDVAHTVGLGGGLSEHYEDRAFMDRLNDTPGVADVRAADYDAIYLTGGHGVMFDFPTSTALAELTAAFYESEKIVSAVCHGPCGLLNVRLSNGALLIQGKDVTGFSWNEEVAAKRNHAVPFSLEEELQRRGAKYSKAAVPFVPHVVEDGRLITGQNPKSARAVGKAVVKALAER
jgi:putative intracellular protease/amidase